MINENKKIGLCSFRAVESDLTRTNRTYHDGEKSKVKNTINERNESCFLESRVSSAKYLGVILDDSLK